MSIPVNRSDYNLEEYYILLNSSPSKNSLSAVLQQLGLLTPSIDIYINGSEFDRRDLTFPFKKLTKIAGKINRNITLVLYNENESKILYRTYPHKKTYQNTIKIGFYHGHFFFYHLTEIKDSNISKYSVSSLQLIKYLSDDQQIIWKTPKKTEISNKISINLDDMISEQEPVEPKLKKRLKRPTYSFADIECVIRPNHVPLMYGRYTDGKFYLSSSGYDDKWIGMKNFLESFPNGRNVVYFHNLKYDWSVIKKSPLIKIINILKKDGQYYSVTFQFYKKLFELRDSYKYIPKKLSDFPTTFDLLNKNKYDLILYELYTPENTKEKDYVLWKKIEESDLPNITHVYNLTDNKPTKHLADDFNYENYILLDGFLAVDRKYIELCGNYFKNNYYYHIAHCELYLKRDCELLWLGMTAFQERMGKILEIDCNDKLTLPSLVHERMLQNGCYQGVYQLGDNLRKFVSKSVHGGRVCTRENKMWDIKGKLQILDARSLYPSAIDRICSGIEVPGFPVGKAAKIQHWDLRDMFDYYVVRIRITKIGKFQPIPMVSYYANSSRIYTNTLVKELEDATVDKLTLEDWVKYQRIEYEFIEGIYWRSGGNSKAGEFVNNLYKSRRKYIEENNSSMSEICKLALNSLYGKTIMKPPGSKLILKDNEDAMEYVSENFDKISDVEECGNQSIIFTSTDETDHSNMAHIGGMILSMARRIINEILALMEELGIVALYTDTDSIHIIDNDNDLIKLIEEYQKIFGRSLIGSNFGQFALELKFPNHSEIYSTRTIILGKKAYLHQVRGKNDGNDTVETYDYCRMKGINKFALSEYGSSEIYSDLDTSNLIKLYERMYRGEEIPFDLTYGDGVSFQIRGQVTNRISFIKKVKFEGEEGKL